MLKHPSNFEMVVEACGKEAFAAAISIAFDKMEAVGWRVYEAPDRSLGHFRTMEEEEKAQKHKWLAVMWHLDDGATPLPYEMNVHDTIEFMWKWLQKNNRPADQQPDIDGDVEAHGFRVEAYAEGWCYDIVRVRPAWALYGK